MKKPYQIEAQRAVRQLEAMAAGDLNVAPGVETTQLSDVLNAKIR